jgi:hypothetical protein
MQTEIRQFITTNELGRALGVQPATIRRGLCVQGHYMSLKPVKLPNNRLLWAADAVMALRGEIATN